MLMNRQNSKNGHICKMTYFGHWQNILLIPGICFNFEHEICKPPALSQPNSSFNTTFSLKYAEEFYSVQELLLFSIFPILTLNGREIPNNLVT